MIDRLDGFADWFQGLVSEAVIRIGVIGAVIGLVIAGIKHAIDRRGGWREFWPGACSAILVGVVVNLLLEAADLKEAVRLGVVSLAIYVSDDALAGVRALGRMFANDPLDAARRVITGLRGGARAAPEPTTPPVPPAPEERVKP